MFSICRNSSDELPTHLLALVLALRRGDGGRAGAIHLDFNMNKIKRRNPAKRILATITQERIDQLSNDLSEGIRSGTVEEWRRVALHFRNAYDKLNQRAQSMRTTLAAFDCSERMRHHVESE